MYSKEDEDVKEDAAPEVAQPFQEAEVLVQSEPCACPAPSEAPIKKDGDAFLVFYSYFEICVSEVSVDFMKYLLKYWWSKTPSAVGWLNQMRTSPHRCMDHWPRRACARKTKVI